MEALHSGTDGVVDDGRGPAGSGSTGRRRLRIAAQLLLGTVFGLGAAEAAFHARDDGAFPHANFYLADDDLGARLRPGATMRFHLHDNPTSEITVNASGYRGADWPAPAGEGNDEIVVVGDSQVFGLGVNDDETFSAKLAEATGRTVLNAGVPTYGPLEYAAVAEEIIEARKPKTLVYTINFLNDPFELERPNSQRHAIWDGWAVRKETAPDPESIIDFPGRQWLYSQSHMFYAARRWWYERDGVEAVDHGVPSEGDWQDLIGKGSKSEADAKSKRKAAREGEQARIAKLQSIETQIDEKQDEIDYLLEPEYSYEDRFDAKVAKAKPGDIVTDDSSEASRSVVVTAELINQAVQTRERRLRQLAKQKRVAGRKAKTLSDAREQLVQERERLRQEIAAGRLFEGAQSMANQREALVRVAGAQEAFETGRTASVFEPHLAELAAMCEAHGVELVVIALPVDVQVSSQEWKKYGVENGPDMAPSLALLADLTASARKVGAKTLDATEALRAAEPGAFLNGDIHMTAKGHAALATALAATLEQPRALVLPAAGLPEGETYPPPADAWRGTDEIIVRGSTDAGCSTMIRGRWLNVRCRKTRPKHKSPTGVVVKQGDRIDALTLVTAHGSSLTLPLVQGEPVRAEFSWEDRRRELQIDWPRNDDGTYGFEGRFVELEGPGRPQAEALAGDTGKAAAELCRCHAEVTRERSCDEDGPWYDRSVTNCRPTCQELWGEAIPSCFAAYGPQPDRPTQCEALLACAQGDPLSPPRCPEGTLHATASNECYTPCDAGHPCSNGRCQPYHGGGICI